MTEYIFGPDGEPIGPAFDAATSAEKDAISACIEFFAAYSDRISYYVQRVEELDRSGVDTVITLINVDDPTGNGSVIANLLMPGEDWQQYRDRGEPPVALGLATKQPFPAILADMGYETASQELGSTDDLRIVLLHAGTVQILDARFE